MKRKDFIKKMALMPFANMTINLQDLGNFADTFSKTDKMPLLFIGHGSPMNALANNGFTDSLKKIGTDIEKPKAILVISAHWLTMNKTYVSVNPFPKTIYDFGGFPDELFRLKYEPQGSPEIAKELIAQVNYTHILEEHNMGLDHGAWTVLRHIYPQADIPTFQMSIDYSKPMQYHFELAKELSKLREKGVLILSSGNIVHNLRQVIWSEQAKPHEWASEFDALVKDKISKRDFASLANPATFGQLLPYAHPSVDHYLPLLYTVGQIDKKDEVFYTYEGVEMGSISMRCFLAG